MVSLPNDMAKTRLQQKRPVNGVLPYKGTLPASSFVCLQLLILLLCLLLLPNGVLPYKWTTAVLLFAPSPFLLMLLFRLFVATVDLVAVPVVCCCGDYFWYSRSMFFFFVLLLLLLSLLLLCCCGDCFDACHFMLGILFQGRLTVCAKWSPTKVTEIKARREVQMETEREDT